MYPVITPFLYLALRTKGGFVPLLVIAGVVLFVLLVIGGMWQIWKEDIN